MTNAKITKKSVKPKKSGNVNGSAANCLLLKGIVRLIAGQLHFADEFGLNRERVFPGLQELLQGANINAGLQQLLADGKNRGEQLQAIFDALVDQQLILTTALDSVAIQAVQVLEEKIASNKTSKSKLQTVVSELKHNQKARYRDLVVPGFLNAYVKICSKEKL
ncbi:MAG: hypothetical protein KAT71_02545 [Gammaproteobacteria bacterium]|nr:hypothetical protein [Gammaproteobacteria bacterium]